MHAKIKVLGGCDVSHQLSGEPLKQEDSFCKEVFYIDKQNLSMTTMTVAPLVRMPNMNNPAIEAAVHSPDNSKKRPRPKKVTWASPDKLHQVGHVFLF